MGVSERLQRLYGAFREMPREASWYVADGSAIHRSAHTCPTRPHGFFNNGLPGGAQAEQGPCRLEGSMLCVRCSVPPTFTSLTPCHH